MFQHSYYTYYYTTYYTYDVHLHTGSISKTSQEFEVSEENIGMQVTIVIVAVDGVRLSR